MLQSTPFQIENRFSIASEQDLMACFRERDHKKLVLPKSLVFPLNIRSYFTWREPSGTYTYLIFKKPNWDLPRGIAFRKFHPSGEATGGICSWCHTYGSSDEIGSLSVAVNANTSFGYVLCSDLRCIEKIEEAAALAGRSPEKNIHQLYHRMGLFFEGIIHET